MFTTSPRTIRIEPASSNRRQRGKGEQVIDDPFDEVIDLYDWVVEPSTEIYTAISANLDADAGLSEEYD